MDLARSLQEVTEEVMLRVVRHVKKETGERFLCLAGGVALNCVGNGKILRSGIYDDIWIQPGAGDAGGLWELPFSPGINTWGRSARSKKTGTNSAVPSTVLISATKR